MSWRAINILLGLAATDPRFFQEIQTDLKKAVLRYDLELTVHEMTILQHISASTLAEFSQQVIEQLSPSSQVEGKPLQ